ncbi:alpha-galactosidase [Aureococcus anophagefferens]|nr:alpha-galactosidase [Aureococcus anophagefferens]
MARARTALAVMLRAAAAYDNGGYAARPPLGWQSWCAVGSCGTDHCFDSQIRETADAMVANGMLAKGYEWIVLDDCWHPARDQSGDLVPYGHYERDARLFAAWAVDWVKMDWCGDERSAEGHANFSRALNATGREMILELCRGPYAGEDGWGYAPQIAQVWRAAKDHHDDFSNTLSQINALAAPGLTDAEYRTEAASYAVLSSPMMVGTDVRNMTKIMEELLLNDELLAIQRDVAHKAAKIRWSRGGGEALVRALKDGGVAVAQSNLGEEANVTVVLDDLCAHPPCAFAVRDVLARRDLGTHTSELVLLVGAHDTALLKLN